jgi:M6 family metalloprotease-like protein
MNHQVFSLCIIAALAAGQLHGALLKNVPVTIVQPNGDTLHLYASGDEFHNWLHDAEQYTILQDHASGYYTYAIRSKDGIAPSRHIAGKADPRTLGLEKAINLAPEVIERKRDGVLQSLPVPRGTAPTWGTIRQIVIFIRFKGEPEFGPSLATYDNLFNASGPGAISESNYFHEVSYGKLTVTSTLYPASGGPGVLSFEDSHPRGYYLEYDLTTNPIGFKTGYEAGARQQTLLSDAIMYVSSQIPSDLEIDADGDGVVDSIVFIVKGEPSPWGTFLWPHVGGLSTPTVRINGKQPGTYNLQLESMTYLGVFVHEMFHVLSAPDLYHYSHDEFMPVGGWDLMEAIATPPEHMGAYMKFR